MYQSFGKTMAVTLTASVGPQVGQSVYMADGYSFDPNDGNLRLHLNGNPVTVVSKSHFVSLDPKPLQELTPAAIVTGKGAFESPAELPQGTKLYPWPDPEVAGLKTQLQAMQNAYEAACKEIKELRYGGATPRAGTIRDGKIDPISVKLDHPPTEEEVMAQYRKSGAALGKQINDPQHPDNGGFDGPTGAE